jgi:hypothetical protein
MEKWFKKSPGHGVTELRVPPDANRVRELEVYCRLVVRLRADGEARHGLRVYVNGSLKWSRKIQTSNPGHTDSLDYRFRAEVPVGEALKIGLAAEVQGCTPVEAVIEVEEE